MTQAYIGDQVQTKVDAAQRTIQWLGTRVNDLAEQLQVQQAAIQRYKAQHNLNDSGPGNSLVDQSMSGLNAQIVQARSDLAEKQAQYDRVLALQQAGNAANSSSVVASPLIAQLRTQESTLLQQESDFATKYGPLHPKMQAVEAQKRDLDGGNYSWVVSPRWYDKRTGDHLALDTGGGPIARLWATALAGKVNTPYVRSTGHSVQITLPKTPVTDEARLEWTPPPFPNTLERDRARMYFVAYAAGMALHFVDQALAEVRAGRTKVFEDFKVPDEAIGVGFHEAVRGVLSHHLVIRDGKIANYQPYPPTPWNASPRDSYGTPGPYEDAVAGTPLFEENGPEDFKGIDIMRTVRSFDPCLPCGVHMYLGGGRVLTQTHSPTLGSLA